MPPAPDPTAPAAKPRPGPAGVPLPRFKPRPVAVRPDLPAGPTAPLLHRVPTTQPVAFITIDDGVTKSPEAIALLRKSGVPVTLFLISKEATKNPGYFATLEREGGVIESHTITHTSLRGLSYQRQRREICGSSDRLGQLFGRRPVLFRPPYGNYDQVTLRAARDCGMKAVLHWKQTADRGRVAYQAAQTTVRAGDIVLMHFRPAFAADFRAVLKAIHDAGLTPALLEDYIG